MNSYFRTKKLVDMINSTTDGSLDKWDIVIATGASDMEAVLGDESTPSIISAYG